jgi:hypothetical protein
VRYEFTVADRLSETVIAAFPELRRSTAPGAGTTLFGPVIDRAHLDGLLARFNDLGLDIVTIHRLPE